MRAPFLRFPWFPLLALLSGFAGYAWVLNNGFISDDVVFLDQSLDRNFLLARLGSAPSAFRMTADLWFAAMQRLFGYSASGFYVFSILLHVTNALLLKSLLLRRGATQGEAALASLLFVVVQNPSEAVAWLSAVNELLVGSFILSVLLTAHGSRYGACLALYGAALISKESAVVAAPLLPLLLWSRADGPQRPPRWFRVGFTLLTAAYLVWYVTLIDTNPLIQNRFYSLGPKAVLVLAYSLHKLAFPWIYLASAIGVAAVRQSTSTKSERRELLITTVWLVLALCPYIFLDYDIRVPSRHLYLAAMPACYLIVQLLRVVVSRRLRWGFVVAFVVLNIAYLWVVKDPQYVVRGRTIQDLVEILKTHPPGCAVIQDFQENPWIAKLSARFVPGWSPEMITVNEPEASQTGCLVVKWDEKRRRYSIHELHELH